jgi:NAD(P)-dependent dehydrogenase (short-subunit alcohol dehydrogenase family)
MTLASPAFGVSGSVKPPPLSEQVVVITGASSGIGRAAAVDFARHGARVALVARNVEALEAASEEARSLGAEALLEPADVSDPAAVEAVADRVLAEFGRIDTWINCASVAEYATVDETSPEEFARIIHVNLLGTVFGSRAAYRVMKVQGYGAIINIGSVLGQRSVPLQAAYSASKHGVKGFTEAFRMEVSRETPGVHVCLVMPSSINTPFFQHARSKQGVLPRPIPPVYEPSVVARALTDLAVSPRRDVVVGGAGKFLAIMERISPGLLDWYMTQGGRMFRQQLTDSRDDSQDNLFEPSRGSGSARGSFGDGSKADSPYTSLIELHPVRKAALVALAAFLLVATLGRVAR